MSTRRRVLSGTGYENEYGYCRAVAVGGLIVVAGTAPVPPDGQPIALGAFDQMLRCGEIVAAALADLGASMSEVVRTRMFITDTADADDIGRAHRILFGEAPPAATMVVVAALLDPAWKIELEVEAIGPGSNSELRAE